MSLVVAFSALGACGLSSRRGLVPTAITVINYGATVLTLVLYEKLVALAAGAHAGEVVELESDIAHRTVEGVYSRSVVTLLTTTDGIIAWRTTRSIREESGLAVETGGGY